jgi:hypothetical protein
MIKILILSLLAIVDCQNVIEIGSSPQKAGIHYSSGGIKSYSGLNGFSGLSSGLGSLKSGQVYQLAAVSPSSYGSYGYNLNAARPVAFSLGNYGLGNYGSYGLGSYGLGNYGLSGLSGLGSIGVSGLGSYGLGNYGVSQYAVRPQAVNIVAAQPAISAQPIAVVAAQPASVNYGVQRVAHYGQQSQQVVPVSAAIHSTRTVEYKPVPYSGDALVPQEVIVEPSEIPLNIHFKSRSSSISVSQSHEAGQPGTVEQTSSQDEPSRVIHEVHKPIIQEVREIITPYRQVTQEVQPVVEQVHTVVSRGEGVRQQYVAQPVVQQQIQQVQQVRQLQAVAQPVQATFQSFQQPAVSSFAIQQQPIAQFAVAQPAVEVQQPAVATLAFAQPVAAVQSVAAQPAVYGQSFRVAAQPAVQSYSFGVAQPASGYIQSVRSVQQPASVVSYHTAQQPSISFRSGTSALNSLVGGQSLPAAGQASFSSYSSSSSGSHSASDDDESK